MTFSSEGPVLHIGNIPDRDQVALYVTHDGEIHPLAYFPSGDRARLASRLLSAGWGGMIFKDDRERMEVAVEDFVIDDAKPPEDPPASEEPPKSNITKVA